MVKGGTNLRKTANKRFKKRKAPAYYAKKNKIDDSVEVDMVVDSNIAGPSTISTVSESKVTDIVVDSYSNKLTGYRFVDMDLLAGVFSVVACPSCSNCSSLTLTENKKQGLAFQLLLSCSTSDCNWSHEFWTSKKKSRKYDVNRRMFYSMRRIGNGYQGLKKFLMLMNHPKPMTEKNYRQLSGVFNESVKKVAKTVMLEAAQDIHDRARSGNLVDTAVSVDGTWQKRGFSSLNGAVAAISIDTGRILDVESMSRYCQGCTNINKYKKDNPNLYEQLKMDHQCKINHEGSAGNMEVTGAKRIFSRSIELYNLQYTEYYGDGDSKSFIAVENTYPSKKVVKKECIGHVQKRVGTQLRKLKKTMKGLGKMGLVDHVIDRLQNYYGMSIRSNIGDLAKMKKAIFAALFHVCSSLKENYHVHCPAGGDSWCSYQRDISNNTQLHQHGKGLSTEVIKHIKPIFVRLSDDQLLMKCLHGKTQNQNESYNSLIWKRTPKDKFSKLTTFEIAVYDSAAHFNVGNLATLMIYDSVGIDRGYYTTLGCIDDNEYRIKNAKRKSTPFEKNMRRYRRGLKKSQGDKTKKVEGKVYGAGAFP